jgi:hypothetical protein
LLTQSQPSTSNQHTAMPAILDVAIGTIFVFLLFSIVVTALNELVLTAFDKRADFLRLGLGELLSDPQHGNITGYRDKARKLLATKWEAYWAWVLGGLAAAGAGISAAVSAALGTAIESPIIGWVLFIVLAIVIAASVGRKAGQAKAAAGKAVAAKTAADKTGASPSAQAAAPNTINVESIFQHPLIFSLSKGNSDPAYIRASAFSKAMLDLLMPEPGQAGGAAASLSALRQGDLSKAITNINNPKLQRSLAALLRSVDGDVDQFKTALEDWFNHSMERVTGWYKRHAQTCLLLLSFSLAVVCNVDAVRIIQTLSKTPNLAHSVAAQAEAYAKANPAPQPGGGTPAASMDAALTDFKQDLQTLSRAGIPMGWTEDQFQDLGFLKAQSNAKVPANANLSATASTPDTANAPATARGIWDRLEKNPSKWYWIALFPMLCGWGLTTLAASLGAPFWFDMLQRVMNLRANGRAPEENALNTKTNNAAKDGQAAALAAGVAAGAAAQAALATKHA